MKAAKPILLSLLLSAFLAGCGDSSTGSDGGDSSDDLSSGTSFVPGSSDEGGSFEERSSDEETSGSSSSRVGKSSAKVSSSSSIAVDYNALCGATPYDSTTHFCDIRDSAVYAMVRIGSQVWMKENLNFDYKIDGASYGSYCYNNSADSCAKYGKLYTWAAATDSVNTGCGYVATWEGATCEVETDTLQGICPNGWHLPDTEEWSTLVAAVADDPVTAGATLKSEAGWLDSDTPGTNSSGFSALPSGFRYNDGNFDYVGCYARFWLSSERKPDDAYDGGLSYLNARAYRFNDYKYYAFSVRCVHN